MHSDVLIVARPDRQPRIECAGGLAARRTEPDTVHLVSTAATPLGGDTIALRVIVETRRTAAAAQRGGDGHAARAAPRRSRPRTGTLEVAGDLDVDPQPTVVAAASRHCRRRLGCRSAGQALVRLRERVQIGRTDERQGFWSGSLHADVGRSSAAAAPDRAGRRNRRPTTCIGAPLASRQRTALSRASPPTPLGTVLELADGGSLATWQGDRLEAG